MKHCKTKIQVGDQYGNVKVLMRAENLGTVAQFLIGCLNCNGIQKVIGRHLIIYANRFKNGCYDCSGFKMRPKEKFKFGRNKHGFIDKSIIIILEDQN